MIKKISGTFLLIVVDLAAVFISLEGAIYIRKNILPHFMQFPVFPPMNFTVFWWVFPIWLLFFVYEGSYTKRFPFWDEVKALWKVSFFSTIAVFSLLYLGKMGQNISRTVIVVMGIISIPILPVVRINIKKFFIKIGLLKSRVLIIGAGKTGELILSALRNDKNLGYDVIGFLDDDPKKIGKTIEKVKIHGGVSKAQKYISKCRINDIVIAMPGAEKEKLISLINQLQHKVKNILVIPDLFGVAVLGTNLQHFFQERAIGLEVKNSLARPSNIIVKRIFDIVMCSLLLILLGLPMLIIAILIKISSKGPSIYSQERIGSNYRTFKLYKFRTMYNEAEKKLDELLKDCSDANNEWGQSWKLKNDPRITKIGSLLRRTSLDELPQVFNVLIGNMSLVGPRPVTKQEIDEHYRDKANVCFGVPPGITGLWQVSGRSNVTYEYRVALDLWYVRNWNLWLDIVLLFKTFKVVLKGDGAW